MIHRPSLSPLLRDLYERVLERLSDETMTYDFKIGDKNYKLESPSNKEERKERALLGKDLAIKVVQSDMAAVLDHMSCWFNDEECPHGSTFKLCNYLGVFSVPRPQGSIVRYEEEEPAKEAHCQFCGRYWLYKGDTCPEFCLRCTEEGKSVEKFEQEDLCKKCNDRKSYESPMYRGNRHHWGLTEDLRKFYEKEGELKREGAEIDGSGVIPNKKGMTKIYKDNKK